MAGQHIVDVACKCWWQSDSSISSTLIHRIRTHLTPLPPHTHNLPSFTAIHTLMLSLQCVMFKCPFSQYRFCYFYCSQRWRVMSKVKTQVQTQVKSQILTTSHQRSWSCCLWSTLNLLASLYPFRSSCSRPWSQPWKSLVNIFSLFWYSSLVKMVVDFSIDRVDVLELSNSSSLSSS